MRVDDEFENISTAVQCVVIGGAPCEFEWIKSDALLGWLGKSPVEAPELYRKAAPTSYASAEDPPFIFFHGSKDMVVPPNSSKKLYDALKKCHVECRYHMIEAKAILQRLAIQPGWMTRSNSWTRNSIEPTMSSGR